MPRKSRAARDIEREMGAPKPMPSCLEAPASLSESERSLFDHLVSTCERDHFSSSDLPLLQRYVESSVLADRAAEELRRSPIIDGKPSPWVAIYEKAARVLVQLSLRLRLSPQARAPRHMRAPEHETSPRMRGGLGITYQQLEQIPVDFTHSLHA